MNDILRTNTSRKGRHLTDIADCPRYSGAHIYREANTVADAFAKHGLSMLSSFRIPFMFDVCNTRYVKD